MAEDELKTAPFMIDGQKPKLTTNFSIKEFLVSSHYPELVKKIPIDEIDVFKFHTICQFQLEPLRAYFNSPLRINSGKRSEELNQKVGGVKTSEHLFLNYSGAIDFDFPDLPKSALIECMGVLEDGKIIFGQAILELDQTETPLNIHLSLPTNRHYYEMLVRLGDKKTFMSWDQWKKKEGLEIISQSDKIL